jgi:CTP synthase
VSERHRHRYEVNNHYRDRIAAAGMVFSGVSPDRELVEYVELPRDVHPFYVGTQAHPELRSRPNRPHPLFRGLVAAALERQQASRLFEVAEPGERPVELHDADGVATPLAGAGTEADQPSQHVEV